MSPTKSGFEEFLGDLSRSGKLEIQSLPQVHMGTETSRLTYIPQEVSEGNGAEKYMAKIFLRRNGNANQPHGFLRRIKREGARNPAKFENGILNTYHDQGLHVPSSKLYIFGKNKIVLMDDLGEDSLEKRLINADPARRIALGRQVLDELVKFHIGVRNVQKDIFAKGPNYLSRGTNLLETAALEYYFAVASSAEDLRTAEDLRKSKEKKDEYRNMIEAFKRTDGYKNFMECFKVIPDGIDGPQQLIHGDLNTYHVFFKGEPDGESVWFVDLGSPRFERVAFDCADLLYSPDMKLTVEQKLDLYQEYLEKSKFVEIKKPSGLASFLLGHTTINPEVLAAENRRFCNAGLVECFKATATSKELYTLQPKVRENYKLQHPEFANPANYKNQSIETIDFMIRHPERFMIDDKDVRGLEKCKPLLTGLYDKAIDESISYGSQQQSLKTGTDS